MRSQNGYQKNYFKKEQQHIVKEIIISYIMRSTIICKFDERNVSAMLRKNNTPWFRGTEVAAALGYANPKATIHKKVKENEKCLKKVCIQNGYRPGVKKYGDHKYERVMYINESGLYRLIFSSKLQSAERFKTWVFAVVLPGLRKADLLNRNILFNETDLHYNVVKFIRLHYPGVKLIPGLGEYQRTNYLRYNAWSKGYTSGQPDLLIPLVTKNHNGLAIELKNPNGKGKVSANQGLWHKYLSDQCGYLVLVSDDYKTITKKVKKYLDKTAMSCQVHRKFYKNPKSLANHFLIHHGK